MIIPDVNLLIYAYNRDLAQHQAARRWWEDCLNSFDQPIGIPWAVALGYIRLMTHPKVFPEPIAAETAVQDIESWLARPHVHALRPGQGHLSILKHLLELLGSSGNLTTDAHIAALALETGAEVHSNDTDFLRFPGIKVVDPLGI
ncbi:MAG TPA: type II toxin-antitoxin system VapC family toxin [Sediminispirochaeta sp.]|nr:type II toxin-antitoxin system VapC family toxin [Sediminispirochaeta sp.]